MAVAINRKTEESLKMSVKQGDVETRRKKFAETPQVKITLKPQAIP